MYRIKNTNEEQALFWRWEVGLPPFCKKKIFKKRCMMECLVSCAKRPLELILVRKFLVYIVEKSQFSNKPTFIKYKFYQDNFIQWLDILITILLFKFIQEIGQFTKYYGIPEVGILIHELQNMIIWLFISCNSRQSVKEDNHN